MQQRFTENSINGNNIKQAKYLFIINLNSNNMKGEWDTHLKKHSVIVINISIPILVQRITRKVTSPRSSVTVTDMTKKRRKTLQLKHINREKKTQKYILLGAFVAILRLELEFYLGNTFNVA